MRFINLPSVCLLHKYIKSNQEFKALHSHLLSNIWVGKETQAILHNPDIPQ
jgi:hypothetical protein